MNWTIADSFILCAVWLINAMIWRGISIREFPDESGLKRLLYCVVMGTISLPLAPFLIMMKLLEFLRMPIHEDNIENEMEIVEEQHVVTSWYGDKIWMLIFVVISLPLYAGIWYLFYVF